MTAASVKKPQMMPMMIVTRPMMIAAFAKPLGHGLGGERLHAAEEAVLLLDDRDRRAEGGVDDGELAGDRAAAEHHEALRDAPRGGCLPVRPGVGVTQAREARIADLQRQLAGARAEIAALTAKVEAITPGPVTVNNPPVDLRALAATVADVLAERLRG